MNSALETMIARYNPKDNEERENAIKEIIQEIALAGLSRGCFFEKAVFYGGTCLRIYHGLDRFSEDLDFALTKEVGDFELDTYFFFMKKEFQSYGLEISIETKKKEEYSQMQSAFIKANTLVMMVYFFPKSEEAKKVISNKKLKIKFEIDTDNPEGGITEYKYKMLPAPYETQIFDLPTLFAGKIHAILCREYKNRVKGRDFYDYLFYVSKDTKFNIIYLENKLKNTGAIDINTDLTLDIVKEMLRNKFETTDYESAKQDVSNFINDKSKIVLWNKELFISTLDNLII